nr:MAG TPA: Protein of unknown function (DUF1156) [Caudoviricetes sp.]
MPIFAVNVSISSINDNFNHLPPSQFHLWWCRIRGMGV